MVFRISLERKQSFPGAGDAHQLTFTVTAAVNMCVVACVILRVLLHK